MKMRAIAGDAGINLLSDEINDVHPKAGDTSVEPPIHHLVDFRPYLRILPIKVRLAA